MKVKTARYVYAAIAAPTKPAVISEQCDCLADLAYDVAKEHQR